MTHAKRGRKPTTGRFETREELVAEVWNRYLNTEQSTPQIARFARISNGTVRTILNKSKTA